MTSCMPTWTKLPPLKLIAAGTSDTESLSSYCLRLSSLCGVSWSAFIDLVDAASESKQGTYRDCGRLSGIGPVVLRRAKTLEHLTGQPLVGATLSGFSEIVSGRSGTLCRTASWCPSCLADSIKYFGTSYSKLIWNLSAYSHCSVHGARIERKCQKCGSMRTKRGNEIVCSRCKNDLTIGARYDPPTRPERWINHCIEELIQWTAGDHNRILERANLVAFIQAADDVAYAKSLRYPLVKGHRNDFVRYRAWYEANVPTTGLHPDSGRVNLDDLLRTAARQCISVLDMLLRPEESASALLPVIRYNVDILSGSGDLPDQWITFSIKIDELLSETSCLLPSMQELARTCGIRGYGRKFFTGHVARYSAQLRMQRMLNREVTPHRVNAAFRQSVQHLRKGFTPQQVVELIKRSSLANGETAGQIVRSASIVSRPSLPHRCSART